VRLQRREKGRTSLFPTRKRRKVGEKKAWPCTKEEKRRNFVREKSVTFPAETKEKGSSLPLVWKRRNKEKWLLKEGKRDPPRVRRAEDKGEGKFKPELYKTKELAFRERKKGS